MKNTIILFSLLTLSVLPGPAFAQTKETGVTAQDWKNVYPLEYYSILAGMDDIDDLKDPNFGYSHGNMAINMMKAIEKAKSKKELNATCFSCTSSSFNNI